MCVCARARVRAWGGPKALASHRELVPLHLTRRATLPQSCRAAPTVPRPCRMQVCVGMEAWLNGALLHKLQCR